MIFLSKRKRNINEDKIKKYIDGGRGKELDKIINHG